MKVSSEAQGRKDHASERSLVAGSGLDCPACFSCRSLIYQAGSLLATSIRPHAERAPGIEHR